MKILALVLLLTQFLVSSVFASENRKPIIVYRGSMTGKELVEFAESYRKQDEMFFQQGAFVGYITATAEAGQGIFFMIPDNVSRKQLYAVVAKYVEDNPSKWHLKAQDLVVDALIKAFPLKKK